VLARHVKHRFRITRLADGVGALRLVAMTDTAERLTAQDELGLLVQCPPISPDEIAGLLQAVDHIAKGEKVNLTTLAKSIAHDDDRLLALLKALGMLGLAELSGGDVNLTLVGLSYARAPARERRQIFAEQLASCMPWVKLVQSRVAADPGQRVQLAEIATELHDRYPAAFIEQGLHQVIDWARYAGLFFYDDRSGDISLQRIDNSTAASARH